MKKFILILLVIQTILFAGCDVNFNIKNYSTGPKVTDTEKITAELNGANKLSLKNSVGTIEIISEDRENISLEVDKEARRSTREESKLIIDNIYINVVSENDKVLIDVRAKDNKNKDFWKWLNDKYTSSNVSIHFYLKIPQHISSLEVYDGVGEISTRNITSFMDLSVGVGDIEVENSELLGSNNFKTGTGSIEVKADIYNAENLTMKTGVGSCMLYLPKESKYTIAAKTGVGNIKGNVITVKKEGFVGSEIEQDINGGGIPVNITVGTGEITLREY